MGLGQKYLVLLYLMLHIIHERVQRILLCVSRRCSFSAAGICRSGCLRSCRACWSSSRSALALQLLLDASFQPLPLF